MDFNTETTPAYGLHSNSTSGNITSNTSEKRVYDNRMCYSIAFTEFEAIMLALALFYCIVGGIIHVAMRKRIKGLDIIVDYKMYYLNKTGDAWFKSPLGPERPIVFELIKVILLTTASCSMYGVMSKQPVVIIWFIYDIAMFINTIVAGWNVRPNQCSVIAFPFFYSHVFIGLSFGLAITLDCPERTDSILAIVYTCIAIYFILFFFILGMVCDPEQSAATRFIMTSCGFIMLNGQILSIITGASGLNMLSYLFLNGMMICVCIITEGTMFRNLPEFVHVLSGLAGFAVYAKYLEVDADFLEDVSHPATNAIAGIIMANLILTVIYDLFVYSKCPGLFKCVFL